MSVNNIKVQDTENTNEWINWIEEAIDKENLNYYEYKQFNNFREIGFGNFGKVYRVSWKNLEKNFAIKSFFNINIITIKEIVRELKIQRKIDFHDNIIRCYGITKFESENHDNNINYMLVMEYADSGNLQNYLKYNFSKLTWDDKYLMAYQLACAVSCLHNEGIVHRDLHSGNILVHQHSIKLADFGLSRRIGESSNSSNFQSKLFGMVPYVDPICFNNNQSTQTYSLNEKSDVYSIGVLLWEISSGQLPFYIEGEQYDVSLALEIGQGLRETIIPDTPEDYVKIYTRCWGGKPDNRPTIYQVVDWLKEIITKTDVKAEILQSSSKRELNLSNAEVPLSTSNSESQGELSQPIQNFNKMSTEVINTTSLSNESQKDLLLEKDFNKIVDEINDFIIELLNKGIEGELVKDQVIEYLSSNYNTNSQEIFDWLSNNQINSNSVFLLGYFNYNGIETNENNEKAFNLFLNASAKYHTLAQYFVAYCYQNGFGTIKNDKLAFKYFEKVADKNYAMGQLEVGYFYDNGIGIKKDLKKAFIWFEKAVNNGNIMAKCNLGLYYKNGKGIEKNYNKAFELFKQSAEEDYLYGITMLAYCYSYGIGTKPNKQKAFELYEKSANLGSKVAQYNVANMYEFGDGIIKDIDKSIYWYEKSSKQGYQNAKNRLETLQKS
ncbi:uncharacterized protein OCT59_024327 [Rhizophagus irregularis]|uniref:Rad53p n=1 Tax=Rhizophagus irregularis (strain DAOM 197198w) TaxID=1432141 RepID=A0A015LV93_RHIIW|nr:Rad53p [Rhizophagus irregularis DAOM 197198w]UZO03927.1 hypothetical protein OCT59_024327 [Rhizophagus irregularis]